MEFFLLGLGLGAAAGFTPGPLHVLVLTTSMQRGLAAGTRVAIAPLLTDVFVVAAAVIAAGAFPEQVVRVLAVGGGLFIIYLGFDALRWRADEPASVSAAVDYRRGFFTNLLNPHPWLFWLGVGGPLLRSAWNDSMVAAVVFMFAFYVLLVGSKVLIAAAASRGTRVVDADWYRWLIRLAAAALTAIGGWLIVAAWQGTL